MSGTPPTPARLVAMEVLRRVFELGAYADLALATVARKAGLTGRERAFAQHLAYGAVRRKGTTDHLINQLAKPRHVHDLDVAVRGALRLGMFEVLFSGSADHAAVDQSVELAKAKGAGRSASFVNAILRRTVREREALLASLVDDTPAEAAIKHSVPVWLAEMWWEELGREQAIAVLAASNEPAETALRVNTLKSDPRRAGEAIAGDDVEVSAPPGGPPLGLPEALLVDGPLDLANSDAFAEGHVTPQSRASMAVTHLLDPQPDDQVLDLCAAPGVKATHIAARMEDRGEVVAIDRNEDRFRALQEMTKRMGASCVRAVNADAAEFDPGPGYDRVLVDPPCSDLGTLASRPDVRWRKSRELTQELAALQKRILARGLASLAPGGTLVYSTCTISEQENAAVAAGAIGGAITADDLGAEHPNLADSHDPRFLQLLPGRDGTDGFFVARFRRTG